VNQKQFILLLVALVVVGGAGLVLLKHNKETWSSREARMGDKVVPNLDPNQVATIHLKGKAEVNVEKSNGVWRVRERAGYPANYQQIKDLLIRVRDLKVVQAEPVGPSQLARIELDEPGRDSGGAALLEFNDAKGKTLVSLRVGKKHERQQEPNVPAGLHGLFDGRYIMLSSEPGKVLLVSDELPMVVPEAGAWLNRGFFKVENVQSIALVSTNPANSWKLSRETESAPWMLMDRKPGESETLDAHALSQTTEMIGFLSFVDVLPGVTGSQSGLSQPLVVNVRTFDHFAYTVKVGTRNPDGNHPMTVSVAADIPGKSESDQEVENRRNKLREKFVREKELEQWVYLAEPQIIEPLIRDRSQFFEKKTVADGTSAATK
jgi:hypothetical protein